MLSRRPFEVSVTLLSIGILLVLLTSARGSVEVVDKRLDQLPYQIGAWTGHDIPLDRNIVRVLNTDAFINRVYSSEKSAAEPIGVYIGYYGTAKGGRTGHNPYACFPSQGWAIMQEEKVPMEVSFANERKKVISFTRLFVKRREVGEYVYHWYQASGDTVLASGIEQNLDRFLRRVFLNRNDGAFIQVTLATGTDTETTDRCLQEFIRVLLPAISTYWPIEKEQMYGSAFLKLFRGSKSRSTKLNEDAHSAKVKG